MYSPKGLSNNSSNCYINSLIQCLFYIRKFRDYFLKQGFDTNKKICSSLKKIIIELNSFNSQKFIIINNNIFGPYEKYDDIIYLLDIVFYSIKKELKIVESNCNTIINETRFDNKDAMFKEAFDEVDMNIIINKLFVGFYESEFKCRNGHLKYSFSNEYKITFPLEEIYNFYNKNNTSR